MPSSISVVAFGTRQQSAARRINEGNPLGVPAELVETLNLVRKRYERCRHVLFGHNGKDREALVARFDDYGFSWDSIQADLACLEHVFKGLWLLADGQPAPTLEASKCMRFAYAAVIDRTVADTTRVLNDLQKPGGVSVLSPGGGIWLRCHAMPGHGQRSLLVTIRAG